MRKMLFIFNPRSGKAQIRNRLMDILDIFTKAGYEVSVHVTQRPKDAMEVAAARGNDADLIVCSGGDGTLNETISGMMLLDRIPDLGYIPAGSTNDFASSLKIPKNMIAAAAFGGGGGSVSCRYRKLLRGQEFRLYRGLWRIYGSVLLNAPG